MEQIDRRTIRLTLTSKHILPDFGKNPSMYSLFAEPMRDQHPLNSDGHADPEDYPEEMNDAVQDMLDRDAGFSEGEIYDAGEFEADDPTEDVMSTAEQIYEEIWRKMQEINQESDDEDDVYVFRTLGEMKRQIKSDGREVIEIFYTEDEAMDDTDSVIVYDPLRPNAVSICRTGAVMSTLICEKGVRHISAYQTPFMPFEIAVYTKKCDGRFTFEHGGSIELDYIVEVRGADMQRTLMTIDVVVI